jgi:Tol biopolymer transport system component
MLLCAGARLGPYEILTPLGAGGMGEVYKALDTRLERPVAVKVLSVNADARRFEQEARAISGLNHPHICTLYDVGRQPDGSDFLVMEYLDGETLASRLARKRLPLDEVMQFACEILDALDHAHRRRIIHRDLKPANVMLVKSESRHSSKLLDFGLARITLTSDTTETLLTKPGAVAGTLRYMAPEQLEGRPADERSDIYAFGLVLEEMLDRSEIAPSLRTVLQRCVTRDPEERWQSARDARAALDLAAEKAPELPVAKKQSRLLWVAAVIAVAGIAAAFWPRGQIARDPVTFTFGSPADTSLIEWPGVPSPDGRRIAFLAQDSVGNPALWVRTLGSQTAQRLPETEGASGPFWSADGKFIGFFAGGKLKKVAISGGPAVNICSAAVDLGATWNGDGDIVFAPLNRTTLFRVPAAGGMPKAITALSAESHENSHRWPHFLPDGRHFLFTARSSDKDSTRIYVGSLDSNETKRLISAQSNAEYAPPGYLLFAREGTLMAQPFDPRKLELRREAIPVAGGIEHVTPSAWAHFSVSADGSVISYRQASTTISTLSWYDRSGLNRGTLGTPGEFTDPNLSPDGKRVALVLTDKETGNRDIWLMDVETRRMTRFTFNAANDWTPVWSPDGAFLAFASDRNARSSIYRKAASGAGEEELLLAPPNDGGAFPRGWSAEGFLLYNVDSTTASRGLWIKPLAGERKSSQVLAGEFIGYLARFSPDGKWLLYGSNESGANEVYVRSVAKPNRVRISETGGNRPRWRRDGKEIFYVTPAGMLMAAAVKMGETLEVNAPQTLFRACPASNMLRGTEQFFDVALDGNRFLMACLTPETKQPLITVSLNWLALVKEPAQ